MQSLDRADLWLLCRLLLGLRRLRLFGADGRHDTYKTTAEHEGDEGRNQHGFPMQKELSL